MLGKIQSIENNIINVKLNIDITKQPNIIGLHLIFEDSQTKVVAEVISVKSNELSALLVGEIQNDANFYAGTGIKPSFSSNIRVITIPELQKIYGMQETTNETVFMGTSNIYKNYKINLDINKFFSNHFSIIGNSGSGKSYTVAGLLQRLYKKENPPLGTNIFLFDAYGEYTNAFNDISKINSNLKYKVFTTNLAEEENSKDIISIPLWLLNVDDFALLLNVTSANQLPIIEKSLKLVPIIIGNTPESIKRKNDIIARAILDVLLSGDESTKIRDQVTAILTKFNTNELNLNSKISEPGYIRTLKQCLFIDKTGKIQEMELVVNYINTFIITDEEPNDEIRHDIYFTLKDLEEAMEFSLISEGAYKSNRVYDLANVLLVRLHSLVNSKENIYFSYPKFITRDQYITELLNNDGIKSQIIDFNISYIDDRLAKNIVKIISKMLFDQSTSLERRGSVPFHIFVEEAHRYVQEDTDTEILGYNIFDKIAKEGRKYGIIIGFITQRPSELSETAISQCSNFVVLRMTHPKDLTYIRTMLPNVSDEIINRIKNLKAGDCLAFGTAFKVPTEIHIELPSPTPLSENVDIVNAWYNISNIQSAASDMAGAIPEIDAEKIANAQDINNLMN